MSKVKKPQQRWVCQACGAVTTGWFGKCPSCDAWNSIEEEVAAPSPGERPAGPGKVVASTEAQTIVDRQPRRPCGMGEVDRVLGGGLVPGSVVLLGGPPGIGKSTLLLQASVGLARRNGVVLYASGEESVAQVASRCGRLGASHPGLLLMAETRIEEVLSAAQERAKTLAALIVDSVQTVHSGAQDGLPGNISQIRAVTSALVGFAKTHGVPVVVVGHVTKDGQLAGPRLLEHLVDAVLSFEGDEERAIRLLRATKNRYGSTQELGVFEMRGDGLREIVNPSEAFITERDDPAIGSCVTASLEGSRPLLLEVQALLAAAFGNPRRTCVGVDPVRLAMLLAVLDRHAGVFALDQDVFVNAVGGMRLGEPASDLAVLLAVASSHRRQPLPPGLCVFGEVGLTGELRPAPRSDARLSEAARLGMKRVLLPTGPKQHALSARKLKDQLGVDVRLAHNVGEALELAFG
ncbi:DNA repair protein RadA [Nannocystis pusilla]|uniref:DNA repair protein RadA n=1 Tax=Nannocystis pusilla TaxID=889268 RepID=UPI003B7B7380